MNSRRRRRAGLVLLALAFALCAGVVAARAKNFELVEATAPSGAKCRQAVPADWNGRLLLIAHGYIPAGRPLYVGFDPSDPVYRPLLDDGWLIAATSYRRNGFLFQEAAADVEELRALVAARQGQDPDVVLVEGTSMGGFVAALLAENPPHPSYRGALGLGVSLNIPPQAGVAALNIPPQAGAEVPALTGKPRFPVLFLANLDEAAAPADYVRHVAAEAAFPTLPVPVVWTVARDGHVNLNRAEVGDAFNALWQWVQTGKAAPPARDATRPPPPARRTVVFARDGRAATGKVLTVDPAFGNLTVDFRPADLTRLGLKKGDVALLGFPRGKGGTPPPTRILLGTTFGDVKEGEWVCFPTADGFTLVCRNFADAAGSTGATVGSPVTLCRP